MFAGMKPVPKALILGVIIALPIWAYTQLTPKSEPVVEAPVQITVVPAEGDAVKRAAELAVQAATPAPEPAPSVTSGDAGLKALLNAGKK